MNELTTLFEQEFGKTDHLWIVRIGANDGVTGDHFWPVIEAHPDWHVLYIEPHPQAFERLLKYIPGCIALNVAISETDEVRTMWEVRLPSDNPQFHHDMLSSFKRDVVMKAGSGFDPYEIQVRCVPLNTALLMAKFPAPDVYLIDTEGYDFEVMKQITNRPKMVVWEFHHLSDEDQEAAVSMWADRGYEIHVTQFDVAAIRRD